MKIRIGSRGSDLALWQAYFVKDQLTELGHEVEIKIIKTQGDKIQHLSFDKMEGKGFFTKEIETALLEKEIDLAIHSHKDLETTQPDGLTIAAVSYREDPRDLLLIRKESFDATNTLNIITGGVIGTSSARRQSQVRALQGDLNIKDLRGNVPTRIQKLREGQYDAIILAAAGITRLKLDVSDLETRALDQDLFVPAPAQGVLALQTRATDKDLIHELTNLHHEKVAKEIFVEREVLKRLEGGCQLPLGAFCTYDKDFKCLIAFAKSKDEAANYYEFSHSGAEEMINEIIDTLAK